MKYWRKPLDQNNKKNIRNQFHLQKERCKGCRICIEFCPKQVLHQSTESNSKGYSLVTAVNNDCLNCGLCVTICPEFAIRIIPTEEKSVHA